MILWPLLFQALAVTSVFESAPSWFDLVLDLQESAVKQRLIEDRLDSVLWVAPAAFRLALAMFNKAHCHPGEGERLADSSYEVRCRVYTNYYCAVPTNVKIKPWVVTADPEIFFSEAWPWQETTSGLRLTGRFFMSAWRHGPHYVGEEVWYFDQVFRQYGKRSRRQGATVALFPGKVVAIR